MSAACPNATRRFASRGGVAKVVRPLSMTATLPRVVPMNLEAWIAKEGGSLKPPVANKLLYGAESELKVMVVGGPNARRDYHVQEGEEFYLQIKGDLVLKVIEQGRHKNIVVKAGESFLLPSRVPHSPQRSAGSIGLVFERSHTDSEMDGMFWLSEEQEVFTREKIEYEEYFHCVDLGSQLAPVIQRYNAWNRKEAVRVDDPPLEPDAEVALDTAAPIERTLAELTGSRLLYLGDEVICEAHTGPKKDLGSPEGAPFDTFVWQRSGHSDIALFDTNTHHTLNAGDVILIPKGAKFDCSLHQDSLLLSVANMYT